MFLKVANDVFIGLLLYTQGWYETICHAGISLAGSKPYRRFFSEKYRTGLSQGHRGGATVSKVRGILRAKRTENFLTRHFLASEGDKILLR